MICFITQIRWIYINGIIGNILLVLSLMSDKKEPFTFRCVKKEIGTLFQDVNNMTVRVKKARISS